MADLDGQTFIMQVPGDVLLAVQRVREIFESALKSGKHKAGDWRQLSQGDLWIKLDKHLTDYLAERHQADGTDDLGNAACRVLMLLQLREESKNFGPNG